MSTGTKRKHKTLTLQEKMEILDRLDKGENMAPLAKEYGVGRATVTDIKTKRSKIEEHVKRMDGSLDNRKTMKGGFCPKMELALYTWYLGQRAKDVPVSGETLKTKAFELFTKLTNKDNFRASEGWLHKFKRRFGIRLTPISVPKTPSEPPAEKPFIQTLHEKIEDLDLNPAQVYIAQQSQLLWKHLPKQPFAAQGRITFMLCTNTSGTHKFDLVVIGANHHPVDDVRLLPVFYSDQPESSITEETLSHWFQSEFVPKVRNFLRTHNLPEKALLMLGDVANPTNAGDLKSNDGMIESTPLPSNSNSTPPLIDDNIIQIIKSSYKEKLLVNIFSQVGDLTQTIQEVNFKNALFSLAQSWYSVPPNTIRSFWKILWPLTNIPVEDDMDTAKNLPVETWTELFAEKDWQVNQEELAAWFEGNDEETEGILADEVTCKEEIDSSSPEPSVKNDEALMCFSKCIKWAEENGVSTMENMVLRNLREKVFKQGLVDRKQDSITEYFEAY